jgi:hypothetical protein
MEARCMPDDIAVQATVVLHLLGRVGAYPRDELYAALSDVPVDRTTAALDSLAVAGIVELEAGGVRATEAVQRLDKLGLIAI